MRAGQMGSESGAVAEEYRKPLGRMLKKGQKEPHPQGRRSAKQRGGQCLLHCFGYLGRPVAIDKIEMLDDPSVLLLLDD